MRADNQVPVQYRKQQHKIKNNLRCLPVFFFFNMAYTCSSQQKTKDFYEFDFWVEFLAGWYDYNIVFLFCVTRVNQWWEFETIEKFNISPVNRRRSGKTKKTHVRLMIFQSWWRKMKRPLNERLRFFFFDSIAVDCNRFIFSIFLFLSFPFFVLKMPWVFTIRFFFSLSLSV